TWHRSAVHRHWGNRTWRHSAARSHPGHRISAPPHLRRRNRGCQNACYHATKENEFSPVHSVIGFKKLNPSGFEKYRRSRIGGNAVVTFGARFSGTNVNAPLFEIALVLVGFDHVASPVIDADHSIILLLPYGASAPSGNSRPLKLDGTPGSSHLMVRIWASN